MTSNTLRVGLSTFATAASLVAASSAWADPAKSDAHCPPSPVAAKPHKHLAHFSKQSLAPAPVVVASPAPPAPPQPVVVKVEYPDAPPVPQQPTGPVPGAGWVAVDFTPGGDIAMPRGTINTVLPKDAKAFVDQSRCRFTVLSILTSKCVQNSVFYHTSQVAIPVSKDHKNYYLLGEAIPDAGFSSTGVAGPGYGPVLLQGLSTAGGLYVGIRGVEIASEQLSLLKGQQAAILTGIAKGTDPIVVDGCGDISNNGSSTKSNTAICFINSQSVGAVGAGNTFAPTSPVNTTGTITGSGLLGLTP